MSGAKISRGLVEADLNGAAEDLYYALVAAKRELWDRDRHAFNLSDFKKFAVVQQIDAALSKARGEPYPSQNGDA
jgi:hypothetical protein